MGARRFGPSNRFLQEDRYAEALSDPDLSTDPLTSNRYSLAGGNPANFVEVDGHFSIKKLWGAAKKKVKPKEFLKEVSGWNDIKRCAGGSLSGCAWAVAGFTPVGKAAKLVKVGASAAKGANPRWPPRRAPRASGAWAPGGQAARARAP